MEWTDFDDLVAVEGRQTRNTSMVNVNFTELLADLAADFYAVSEEEHVADCLERLLAKFASRRLNLSSDFDFRKRSNELFSKPDLVVMKRNDEALGVGEFSEYRSLPKGDRASTRRGTPLVG